MPQKRNITGEILINEEKENKEAKKNKKEKLNYLESHPKWIHIRLYNLK